MELQGMLTQRGRQLRAAALTGTDPLVFTRFAAGSGMTAPEDTVLAEEQQVLDAEPAYADGDYLVLPVILVESEAETAYSLTEVGVYVQDGAGESLYCVYRMTQALEVNPASAMTVYFELEEVFSEGVEVTVSPAQVVLRAQLGVAGGIATLDDTGAVPVTQMPYTYGTEELEAGVTPLETGKLHFVYE